MNEQLTLHNQMLDALLLDYTTGSLSRPLELLVETHIAMNPSSARALQLMLKLGGVLLEDIEPVSMSEGALDKVMREIEQDNDNQINMPRVPNRTPKRPIDTLLPQKDCKKSWRRIGIGVSEHIIDFGDELGKASFYRIAPGRSVPSHHHEGAEITLVLEGGFTDEFGSYGPGDISIHEAGSEHQPVADNDGECLVFAVNEGNIRLTGPLGRVISMIIN